MRKEGFGIVTNRTARPSSAEEALNLTLGNSGRVTAAWLAKAFGMEVSTVRLRLADCPAQRKNSGYVYSIREASKYLVEPVRDIDEFLSTLKPEELPLSLRVPYWDAMLKRQKWEETARQLWRTDDVLAVYAETLKMVRERTDLWADTVEQQKGLTPDQRRLIVAMVDKLQEELQDSVVSLAKKANQHLSSVTIADSDMDKPAKASKTELTDDDVL